MVLTKEKLGWLIIKKKTGKEMIISLKMGYSKFLVDKTRSIVVFNTSELVMTSRDGFPYNNVRVKEETVFSNNLQSILL